MDIRLNKKWIKEHDEFLIANYPTMNINEMGLILNRTKYSIVDRATKTLNINRDFNLAYSKGSRKYFFDEDYFNSIDSAEKSYWYGFIWADGSLTKNSMSIALAEKDKKVLEMFNRSINGNYPLEYIVKNKAYKIRITSYKTAKDLRFLNILPNKTYLNNIPIISDKWFIPFLLGVFDGDGCFCKNFSITNTKNTCLFIQEKLKKLFDIDSKVYKRKNTHASQINVMKKEHFTRLYRLLYDTDIFFLERKRIKYHDFIFKKKD